MRDAGEGKKAMIDARTYTAWMKAGIDAWLLGAEVGTVVALRLTRIASEGLGGGEAMLMVTEKIRAAIELQTRMATGAFGTTPLGIVQGATRHYRRKVAANRRRLTR